jgi:hypothetical protein
MLRGQLEGAGRVPLLPGQDREGSQKSKEFDRFPSGDLDRERPGRILVYEVTKNLSFTGSCIATARISHWGESDVYWVTLL